MYNSPVKLYETAMKTIIEERENAIFAKVQDAFDVQVDKAELIRALQYDRGQYEKGYFDGKEEAAPKWIPASELLPAHGDDVLTYTKYKEFLVAQWDCFAEKWITDTWDYAKDSITHWMSLPEAPEENCYG